jgi:hypothetical protein
MYAGRLKSNFASILAFGRMSGMNPSSHRKFIPAVAKEIIPMPLTMSAADIGSDVPELPGAIPRDTPHIRRPTPRRAGVNERQRRTVRPNVSA